MKRLICALLLILLAGSSVFAAAPDFQNWTENTWIWHKGPEIPDTGRFMSSYVKVFQGGQPSNIALVIWELWTAGGFRVNDVFAKFREIIVYADGKIESTQTFDFCITRMVADAWDVPLLNVEVFLIEETRGAVLNSLEGVGTDTARPQGKWNIKDYEMTTKGKSLLPVKAWSQRANKLSPLQWELILFNKETVGICQIELSDYEDVPFLRLEFYPAD